MSPTMTDRSKLRDNKVHAWADNIISKDILLYTLVSLSVSNIGKFNFIKLKCQKQVLLA